MGSSRRSWSGAGADTLTCAPSSKFYPFINNLHPKHRRAIIRKYYRCGQKLRTEVGTLSVGRLHTCLSLLLCILFLIALSPASSGERRRDNFRFEIEFQNDNRGPPDNNENRLDNADNAYNGIPTIIEGDITDDDNDNFPIGGARVVCNVYSENIVIDNKADENGYFRIPLPDNLTEGEHTYSLNVSAPGYDDNDDVTGTFSKGDTKYVQIKLRYNPFDVSIAPASGSMTRQWNAFTSSTTYQWRMNTDIGSSKTYVRLLGGHRDYTNDKTSNPNYYERVWKSWGPLSYWGDYDYSTGAMVYPSDYVGKVFVASSGSEVGLDSSLKNVSYRVNYVIADGHYVTRRAGYLTYGGYRIYEVPGAYYIHFQAPAAGYSGITIPAQNFTITHGDCQRLSDMPYYYNNGSFVRIDATDYSLAPWDNVQTTITVTSRNGYTGNVKLVATPDNGLSAVLGQNVLSFASPDSTTLTIKPNDDTQGSVHSVTVSAYDSNNRLVFGSPFRPPLVYNLGLTTPPKPDPTSYEYLMSSGSSYVGVTVRSLYSGPLPMASVKIIRGDGSVVAAGSANAKGEFIYKPSLWPLNANLQITASYPGYFAGGSSVNTGSGGACCASIALSCGDFGMGGQDGYAEITSGGYVWPNNPGTVGSSAAWPWPRWLGGGVSLSGEIVSPNYFSSYLLGRSTMTVPDAVSVKATPKASVATTCAVRVYGTAGTPTNYRRNADVGYTVRPASH